MRRLFTKLLCYIAVVAGMVACAEQNGGVAPTITLTPVESDAQSITFVINTTNAESSAYMLYNGESVTVADVFAKGTKSKGGLITIKDLEANTKYYVAAAARNGDIEVMAEPIIMTTKSAGDDNGGNGGNGDDNGDNGGNGGNGDLPDIDGVENIVITKTKDGRWYEPYNYYVTFVRDNGDRIILDFYTLDETMSLYLPYGQYTLSSNYHPFTIYPDTSGYIPAGKSADGEGYNFTDAYVTVDVVDGYYAIYMMLTYEVEGVTKSIQGYYHGILSGASVPEGDDDGSKELIEVLEVGSTSFQFRINAEEGQYWRCSVVDKRVYDQTQSNPGAWVVTYGFMLEGPLTFNWEHGKECEYIQGLMMSVTPSTDYIIMAALMDYSDGQENSLLGGVEMVQIRTEAPQAGTGTADITIKEIHANDIVFDCVLSDDVWCCYVALLESSNIVPIEEGAYVAGGYSSFEECMLSLIPDLSYDSMRQIMQTTYDYKWEGVKYGTEYKMYAVVEDMNKGRTFFEVETFTTPR